MIEEIVVLRNYAHIGDSVWELFVRTYTIFKTSNSKVLHKITTERVNATFQKDMLNLISAQLTEEEQEIARRGRNLPIPVARKKIQADYRQATAFEVLIGVVINHLFNDGKIDAVTIAKYAQQSEREFFGKPCGLMDQMASSVGGFTAIDFADPQNPVIEKVDFDLAQNGHALCIINTGGNHTDLTDDYADITVECTKVSQFFGKRFLREVSETDFFADIADLRKQVGDRAILRAIHFFSDNKRALDEKQALSEGNFDKFLKLINESGDSSFKYLQNVYSISNVSEQGLSLALALTDKFLGGRGACRVHGGGFAGTVQAFVPLDMLDDYIAMIESAFGKGNCHVLKIRPVGGTKIF